jgi:hypothetical protein
MRRGEPKALSILRGLLASLAILALVVFGWYQAVVSPVSESGRTFHRQYYVGGTEDTSHRIDHALYTARGKLVLVSTTRNNPDQAIVAYVLVGMVHPSGSDATHCRCCNSECAVVPEYRMPCREGVPAGILPERLQGQQSLSGCQCSVYYS